VHLKIALSNEYCTSTCALSAGMGVFRSADDTSGICKGLLNFSEKCILTEKSEMFLVQRSFTKSKLG